MSGSTGKQPPNHLPRFPGSSPPAAPASFFMRTDRPPHPCRTGSISIFQELPPKNIILRPLATEASVQLQATSPAPCLPSFHSASTVPPPRYVSPQPSAFHRMFHLEASSPRSTKASLCHALPAPPLPEASACAAAPCPEVSRRPQLLPFFLQRLSTVCGRNIPPL